LIGEASTAITTSPAAGAPMSGIIDSLEDLGGFAERLDLYDLHFMSFGLGLGFARSRRPQTIPLR
jgi:hypothetical protein